MKTTQAGNFVIQFDETDNSINLALDFGGGGLSSWTDLNNTAFIMHDKFPKIDFTEAAHNIINDIKFFILKYWYKPLKITEFHKSDEYILF